MASRPVEWRPPWVKISQRACSAGFETFLASIATTMHWSPNFSAASLTKARRATAAVLIDTLSAPEVSSLRISSTGGHRLGGGIVRGYQTQRALHRFPGMAQAPQPPAQAPAIPRQRPSLPDLRHRIARFQADVEILLARHRAIRTDPPASFHGD